MGQEIDIWVLGRTRVCLRSGAFPSIHVLYRGKLTRQGWVGQYISTRRAKPTRLAVTMGSIWGLSASSASENLSVELRGVATGTLQQGGYFIAAVAYLYLVPDQSQRWRALF